MHQPEAPNLQRAVNGGSGTGRHQEPGTQSCAAGQKPPSA